MEAIYGGEIPGNEIIDELFKDETTLRDLIGFHGVACFALVRQIIAPNFYEHLIKNVDTIDATTRNHVAFIVFYGDKASFQKNHNYYGVQGISVSAESHYTDKVIRDRKRNFKPKFDELLAEKIRFDPHLIDPKILSHQMTKATTRLMELYSIKESFLPCLLFVDAKEPSRKLILPLSPDDPLESLYTRVLQPLSEEFMEFSDFWKRKNELSDNERDLDYKNEQLSKLPIWIEEVNQELIKGKEELQIQIQKIDQDDSVKELQRLNESLERNILDSENASKIKKILNTKQDRTPMRVVYLYEQRAIMETKLKSIRDGSQTFRSNGHRALEEAKLIKRLIRNRNKLLGNISNLKAGYTRDNIYEIIRQKDKLEQKVENLQSRKNYLEDDLNRTKDFVQSYDFNKLEKAKSDIIIIERLLRLKGFGDDAIDSINPSAFSIIKVLFEREKIGFSNTIQVQRGVKSMKILFLAANPTATTRLDLEEELRALELEIKGVNFRDNITLIARHAVRPDDLVRFIREDNPTIIHFSGHGATEGIILRNDIGGYQAVNGANLQRFLKDRGVELVVLNSCYSQFQAKEIRKAVSSVVGTTTAVGDEAARRFTVSFYRTLGNGFTVKEAFRDGCDAVVLHGLEDVFYSSGNLNRVLISK